MNSELFRFVRVTKRLTQREFAEAIGVSHGLVAQIEAGMKRLTPRTITKVRQAFALTDEELMRLDEVLNCVG